MLASATSTLLKSEKQLRHEITWKNSRKGMAFYSKNSCAPVRVGDVDTIYLVGEYSRRGRSILGNKGDFLRRPLHGILLQY